MQNSKNNIFDGQPWIIQRADPYVYLHEDGWYYFTASVPAYDGICLRRAKSLEELAMAKEVEIWHKHEEGIMSIHVWAPELHYLDGQWYIYYAAGDKDDIWAIRPYVLHCLGQDPMTDSWEELGKLQRAENDDFSFEAFSLDTTVFESAGVRYIVWAEKVSVGKQISNLYIAKLEKPWKLATAQVLLTTPDYDWERGEFWVNEGPAVIKHDGRIFLTFSASDTGPSYCVGLLYAKEGDDLTDPGSWTKCKEPVLQTREDLDLYGPGHNSFTKDENGRDICVFHGRKKEVIVGDPLYNPNRHARLIPVTWNEQGMPEFHF